MTKQKKNIKNETSKKILDGLDKLVLKKPIFELKVNSWNKRTKKEQDKAILWIHQLIADLNYQYRKSGISDEFNAQDK